MCLKNAHNIFYFLSPSSSLLFSFLFRYTGTDCSLRSCSSSPAWYDEASSSNTAHASAECSNRGVCDTTTGTCACDTYLTGTACGEFSCPSATGGSACNGAGTCQASKFF